MEHTIRRRITTIKILLVCICAILIYILFSFDAHNEKEGTKLFMFDVGQGDSFLIDGKNKKTILVDGGKNSQVLLSLSKALGARRNIDVVVATHPDADHIGGLVSVLERYSVGVILISGVQGDTSISKQLYELIKEKKIPLLIAQKGVYIALSPEEKMTVLFPDRDVRYWETNASSIVSRFDADEASVLFTGDSPLSIEKYLVNNYKKHLDVDELKLGHHGSRTSTSEIFVRAATPEFALISAGKNNSYGHPHKEVTDILSRLNVPWISTQTEGTVTFFAEGGKWAKK